MPAYTQNQLFGSVAATLPTKQSDGTLANWRVNGYGEALMAPVGSWRQQAALDGTYYEFHNTTLDSATTIAGHAAPVVADIDATFTKPLFWIANIGSASSTKRLMLDWLEIEVATAGANGTDSWWADELDTSSRYTSGGTALTVVNPNMGASNSLTTSDMTILGGPVVVPVETASNRKLGFSKYRAAIEVACDRKIFCFGTDAPPVMAAAAPTGRTDVFRRPPVVLPPGYAYMLGIAAAAQDTAGVYKIRGGLVWR